eukprot:m.445180 g.445180  ORF g.445180 m.445180 type:complete len:67 (+) comp21491_c0_seq11:667-867(+)
MIRTFLLAPVELSTLWNDGWACLAVTIRLGTSVVTSSTITIGTTTTLNRRGGSAVFVCVRVRVYIC